MLESELTLALVTGIGLTKYSVSVSWDDLSALKVLPDPFLELFLTVVEANFRDNLVQEDQDLIISYCYDYKYLNLLLGWQVHGVDQQVRP